MHDPARTLLVTGGAGFIGGNFVRYWTLQHPRDRIVVLDALTYAGNRATLDALAVPIELVHGDIADESLVATVFDAHDVDVVVHFAAETHVDRSITGPGTFVRTNVLGTGVLLEAARAAWRRDGAWRPGARFHHVSTDEVYGSLGPHDAPFTEHSPYAPSSPYAASKAGADHLVRAYRHTYGMPTSISNCSNNYGPFQFPEKLVPLLIVNALDGRPLPVYGDGRQVRDWLHVEDHCAAIDHILRAPADGRTWNVGGRAERANLDIVHAICTLVDGRLGADPALRERFPHGPAAKGRSTRELVTHVRDRPGHDRRYAIDPTRIASELGFAPAETLDSGLARTLDWFLDHEPWWRAVMDGSYRDWITRQYGRAT